MTVPDNDSSGLTVGDLSGLGKVADSEIAKKTYDDGISPAMKQVGGLTEDTLKALRLFTAPIQLAAAYQDRFRGFCDRVREKVPEEFQCDAPPEVAKPVMEAFASTRDDSPLMEMFEELMSNAIDTRESEKLSPQFAGMISSLSPLQALLIADLASSPQVVDDIRDVSKMKIVQWVATNFDIERFGGTDHHLTITQDLAKKDLVARREGVNQNAATDHPNLKVPEGLNLYRTTIELTMRGKWFASACVPSGHPRNRSK